MLIVWQNGRHLHVGVWELGIRRIPIPIPCSVSIPMLESIPEPISMLDSIPIPEPLPETYLDPISNNRWEK